MRQDVQFIIALSKYYVLCDEPDKALWLLQNPPAFLRQPLDANLKNEIDSLIQKKILFCDQHLKNFLSPHKYYDIEVQPISQIVLSWVHETSQKEPIIVTHTSDKWIDDGLEDLNYLKNAEGKQVAINYHKLQKVLNLEMYLKCISLHKSYIWISVPKFCSQPQSTGEIKALRAFTAQEFTEVIGKTLINFDWSFSDQGNAFLAFGVIGKG